MFELKIRDILVIYKHIIVYAKGDTELYEKLFIFITKLINKQDSLSVSILTHMLNRN